MKKCIVSIVAVLVLVALVLPLFGQAAAERSQAQREGRQRFGNLSAEEREQMRERFQNMSEEERAKFREQMRGRFGSRLSREDQLKAIAAVQAQLSELKKAIETGSERPTNFRDLSEEERAKFREQMTASFQARQKALTAIDTELEKLRMGRRSSPEQRTTANLRRLRALHELAVKEKAAETTKGLEEFIAQQERQLEGDTGQRQPGDRGPRESGTRRPGATDRPRTGGRSSGDAAAPTQR
jgi:hypothetical protein